MFNMLLQRDALFGHNTETCQCKQKSSMCRSKESLPLLVNM